MLISSYCLNSCGAVGVNYRRNQIGTTNRNCEGHIGARSIESEVNVRIFFSDDRGERSERFPTLYTVHLVSDREISRVGEDASIPERSRAILGSASGNGDYSFGAKPENDLFDGVRLAEIMTEIRAWIADSFLRDGQDRAETRSGVAGVRHDPDVIPDIPEDSVRRAVQSAPSHKYEIPASGQASGVSHDFPETLLVYPLNCRR